MSLNNTVHSAVGLTSFNCIYGRDARLAIDSNFELNSNNLPYHEMINDMLLKQKYAQEQSIKIHAERDAKLKQLHDKNVKLSPIVPGSIVYWKTPQADSSPEKGKLQYSWRGPYIVVERHPHNTVTLKHLHSAKFINHQVSISQLKIPNHYRNLEGEIVCNPRKNTVQDTSDPVLDIGPMFAKLPSSD